MNALFHAHPWLVLLALLCAFLASALLLLWCEIRASDRDHPGNACTGNPKTCGLHFCSAYPDCLPIAPAVFIGTQTLGAVSFDLYNLTQDIPGHPVNSTVSGETLTKAGYRLPEKKSSQFIG